MDMWLLGITGASLLAAIVSSTVAWKVTRAERRRHQARVTALAAAGGQGASATPSTVHPALNETVAHTVPERALLREDVSDAGSRSRQRALVGGVAACAGMLFVATGLWLFDSRSSGTGPGATGVPVELVSLDHARADGAFAVTGVVRNPAAGSALRELEADVRVFDAAGILIATKAARIAQGDLAPGRESPFEVGVGEARTAARYRVSFRSRGTLVPHVDRRVNGPAAVSRTADAR